MNHLNRKSSKALKKKNSSMHLSFFVKRPNFLHRCPHVGSTLDRETVIEDRKRRQGSRCSTENLGIRR